MVRKVRLGCSVGSTANVYMRQRKCQLVFCCNYRDESRVLDLEGRREY